jgi:hypothetical protein
VDELLSKYIVLVPLSHNDGRPVREQTLRGFQNEVYELGGGFSVAGTVQGAYRMADGTKQVDQSLQYWICISNDKADKLAEIVARLGAALGQESMYLERTGGSISFIRPKEGSEEE